MVWQGSIIVWKRGQNANTRRDICIIGKVSVLPDVTDNSEFNNTYLKALHLRHLLKRELAQTFQRVDMLLHPTAIQTAPLHSHCKSEYLQDLLTVPASLAGLPAMSVPAGRSDGWPVGVSVVGRWGTEKMLFKVGKEIEQVMG